MSQKYLLREYLPLKYNWQKIYEDVKKEKNIYLVGPLIVTETLNRNNRIYPTKIVKREVEKYKYFIEEGLAAGMLDHPQDPFDMSCEKVSHRIVDIWWHDETTLYGKILIAHTPKGEIVKGLLQSGFRIGVSSRGVGTLRPTREGYELVGDDYDLIAFDLVLRPSTPRAYLMPDDSSSIYEWHKMPIDEKLYKKYICDSKQCRLIL